MPATPGISQRHERRLSTSTWSFTRHVSSRTINQNGVTSMYALDILYISLSSPLHVALYSRAASFCCERRLFTREIPCPPPPFKPHLQEPRVCRFNWYALCGLTSRVKIYINKHKHRLWEHVFPLPPSKSLLFPTLRSNEGLPVITSSCCLP